jgi:hypothetical protein
MVQANRTIAGLNMDGTNGIVNWKPLGLKHANDLVESSGDALRLPIMSSSFYTKRRDS